MTDLAGMMQRPTPKDQRSVWDDAYRQGHPRWRGPSDIDISDVHGRVLELGCGDGKTAIAMAKSGLDVVGLDSSRKALSTLLRRGDLERLQLIQGDALELPFRAESFDCVSTVHLIDNLLSNDRIKAVAEIRRVLKSQGLVIGRFFSLDDMRSGKGKEIEPNTYLKGNGVLNHYFSEQEIRDLFVGFDEVSFISSTKRTKFPSDSGQRALITVRLRKP